MAAIQPVVAHLTAFIRQPSWVLGPFGEEPREYTADEVEEFKANSDALLLKRKQFENITNRYFAICDRDGQAQAQIRTHLTTEMKKKISSEALQQRLIPQHGVGCRRPTTGIGFLESLASPNTEIVWGPIHKVTQAGVVDCHHHEHPLDILVCATGFDTTYVPRFPLVGCNGINVQDKWAQHPRAYMATATDVCPNYFMFCGPNNPFASGAYLRTVGKSQFYQT